MTDHRHFADPTSRAQSTSKVIGVVTVGDTTAAMLDEILSQSSMAAVIVVVPSLTDRNTQSSGGDRALRDVVRVVQSHQVAALIRDDWVLAKALSADGVHLTARTDAVTAYLQARAVLGPDASIGVDAGGSRHTAMELGQAGCDYVAFGLPAAAVDGAAAAIERDELIAWWADVFEVPCVAIGVRDAAEGGSLAEAGADFVAYDIDMAGE